MEFDAAIQLIAVLIAVWTLYVTRRASPPRSSFKKSFEASIACIRRLLQKQSAVLGMLNIVSQKKSRRATESSTSQKKARDVHVLFTEKTTGTIRSVSRLQKEALPVNNCGQKKTANIGIPIENASLSGIPLKKSALRPIFGSSKKSLLETVFGLESPLKKAFV